MTRDRGSGIVGSLESQGESRDTGEWGHAACSQPADAGTGSEVGGSVGEGGHLSTSAHLSTSPVHLSTCPPHRVELSARSCPTFVHPMYPCRLSSSPIASVVVLLCVCCCLCAAAAATAGVCVCGYCAAPLDPIPLHLAAASLLLPLHSTCVAVMSARPSTRGSARPSARTSAAVSELKESASEKRSRQLTDFSLASDDSAAARAAIVAVQSQIATEDALIAQQRMLRVEAEAALRVEQDRRRSLQLDMRAVLEVKSVTAERNGGEAAAYRDKMRSLLLDHTSNVNGLRIQQRAIDVAGDEQRRLRLAEVRSDVQRASDWSAYRSNDTQLLVNRVKLSHEQHIMLMREEYERRSNELRQHYHKVIKEARDEREDRKRRSLQQLERNKQTELARVMAAQKASMDEMKKFYSDITHSNLELIKNLKEELGDMKKKEQSSSAEMAAMTKQNGRLEAPLRDNEAAIALLAQQMAQYGVDKAEVARLRQDVARVDGEMERVGWETEVVRQKKDIVDRQRADLQADAVRHASEAEQQRSMANLLLGKRLDVLRLEIEKAEAGLSELLLSSGLAPSQVGGVEAGLEDVLQDKNKRIMALEDEVKEWKARFARMMSEYRQELQAYGIPLEELGFQPVNQL